MMNFTYRPCGDNERSAHTKCIVHHAVSVLQSVLTVHRRAAGSCDSHPEPDTHQDTGSSEGWWCS